MLIFGLLTLQLDLFNVLFKSLLKLYDVKQSLECQELDAPIGFWVEIINFFYIMVCVGWNAFIMTNFASFFIQIYI